MSDFGPLSDRIIPIPIRDGVTVNIFGIPHDLAPAEARKIAAVVTALAASTAGPARADQVVWTNQVPSPLPPVLGEL